MENLSISGIGKRIADKRKEAGLTQTEVADEYGYAQSAISAIEKEDQRPSLDFLVWFSKKVKSSVQYLVVGEESKISAYKDSVFGGDSINKISAPYQPTPDLELIKQVIESVEEHLQNNQLVMPPAKIAELVAVLYEEISESSDKQVNKGTVSRLIKLAS
jgi:transcriptional regulator with XRE-family HTH domain